MKRALLLLLSSSLGLAAPPALALTQPDGTPIPTGGSLQGLFDSRGESIDALASANIVPETFIPSCALKFEVLQRNAGYQNSFGWYNVTGSAPSPQDLHEFLACTDGVGTVKELKIKTDPAYAGGEVGFYEATGGCATLSSYAAIFFSETKYNPDGSAQNPYIHLLIYDSTVTAKAFYFGWEDLLSGGDNDFDDLTTFVTGISCSGGGGACQTGQLGICAEGTMQCQSGVLACVQSAQPAAEACNGLDDDCNGAADDGAPCDAGYVCDHGTCVHACGGAEFECPPDKLCNASGYCVDPACLEASCGPGTTCVAGACVGPCDGVVCPHGQVCLAGVCKDPCLALSCDPDQVCVLGACVDDCHCGGCAAGQSCQPDGRCIDVACEGKTCPAGTYCAPDGTCADACLGATCPAGQSCAEGQCVQGPNGAGGGASGTGGSGWVFEEGGAGGDSGHAQGGAGSTPVEPPSGSDAGPREIREGGCGCRAGQQGRAHEAVSLFLLGLACVRRRRPKRHG